MVKVFRVRVDHIKVPGFGGEEGHGGLWITFSS